VTVTDALKQLDQAEVTAQAGDVRRGRLTLSRYEPHE